MSPVEDGATISLPLRDMGHAVPLAELVHQSLAFDAEPRLQRAGRIVDAGVDHAAVMRARVEPGPGVPFEHADGPARAAISAAQARPTTPAPMTTASTSELDTIRTSGGARDVS